ncbi:lipoprotein LpqV [Mycobacterium hubeiense]|uniref:lipoprotein LpqV n=1 Tax=Mycobacterium hubeiense TaxID=1867256 RepID=UPI000C7F06EC|nr:lipoprotein LpqV [Mycobacterium sp. QGD 101]
MRRYLLGTLTAACAVLAACSTGTDSEPTPAPATTTQTSETHKPAPGAVEVSPGGVTTAIGADADSTEDEYFQACKAAKDWMDQQGGDRKSQIEPYLQTLQAPDATPGPATFNEPWAQLSPARQAAVIVAVQAAADELCG